MNTDLSQQRVNYDTIAHLYDEPIRDHAVDENLAHFLAARGNMLQRGIALRNLWQLRMRIMLPDWRRLNEIGSSEGIRP